MLFPVLTWLFIQFAMSGFSLGPSAAGETIVICSAFGTQEITIDPETGQPQEQAVGGDGCDWCLSFGLTTDTVQQSDAAWVALARSLEDDLPRSAPLHKPLRLVGDYQSRAPPIL